MAGTASNIPDVLFSITITGPEDVYLAAYELLIGAEYSPTVWNDPESSDSILYLYYDSQDKADTAKEHITRLFSLAPELMPCGSFTVHTGRLQKNEWTEYWKHFLHTERIGTRLVVKPQWEEYVPQDHDVILDIDPGMAFGTGQHGTTRACLELLEQIAGQNTEASLLDVGTGSGILSIAAAKLGFSPIDAFDNFPDAVCIAAENFRENGVEPLVTLFTVDLDEYVPERQYDVVVANVLCTVLTRNAQTLAACMKDSGTLILSGILKEQYHEIEAAFTARGLVEKANLTEGDWKTGWFAAKSY